MHVIDKIRNFFTRASKLDEQLFKWVSVFTAPATTFSNFTVEKAVRDGYIACIVVFRCVNLLDRNLRSLPFKIVDKDGKPKDHYLLNVFRQPTPELSPKDFWSMFWKHYFLTGNAYIRKIKLGKKTVELFSMFPDKIQIQPSQRPGILIDYFKDMSSGQQIAPEEVVHFKNIDPRNALIGIGNLQAAARAVDVANEQDKWNLYSLVNRFVSDYAFLLKDDPDPKTVQTLLESIRTQYSGAKNSRKIFMSSGIEKIEKLGTNAVDADFVEGKKQIIADICSAFNIPLPVYGLLEHATLNNMSTIERFFWEQTILPEMRDLCETLNWAFSDELGDLRITYSDEHIKALHDDFSQAIKDAQALFFMGVPMEEINRRLDLELDLTNYQKPEPNINL